MQCDIQKASLWKRFAAALLDLILVVIIVTGLFSLLAGWFHYDSHVEKVGQIAIAYSEKYDLKYELTEQALAAMSPEEHKAYNDKMAALDREMENDPDAYTARVAQADQELGKDGEAAKVYTQAMIALLTIITLGIFIAMLVLEFAVPLLFKNGQTVGKKIFSLAVVRQDSVKVNPLQLFVRAVIGRFAVETMIPVCIGVMYLMGFMNMFLLLLLAALVIGEIACIAISKNNCLLHDLMAGTAVVDHSCQMIFASAEEKEAYEQKLAAENQNRQIY